MDNTLNSEPIFASQAPTQDGTPLITQGNSQNFPTSVIQASMDGPVIAYFTSPSCGPCRQLGPALERAINGYRGKVRMVKINVDENQELAAQLRVQSVPTVFAFQNGQPVNAFQGAQPESQLKAFFEQLFTDANAPIDAALDEAEHLLEGGNSTDAGEIFRHVQAEDQGNERAIAGIIRTALFDGDTETLTAISQSLPEDLLKKPLVAAALTAVELAAGPSADQGQIADLEKALETNADDHQARFDLAMALYATSDSEAAIDQLIELMRRNREWNEEAARLQLIKIFEALGPGNPLANSGRRKMSTVLFS